MGEVHRARDRATGAVVALNRLTDLRARDRFAREAEILARLDHPRVVRYVAHGEDELGPWLAMEWLDGETLAARLRRGPLGPDETLALATAAAEALAAVHRLGVIHRDVKPSNLFLVGGRPEELRLLDFGITRVVDRAATRSGERPGTLAYMAPEQALGAPDADARSDVFSLGCVLHECLTGAAPFAGSDALAVLAKTLVADLPDARQLRPDVPAGLAGLVERMTAKDPARRPAGGAALLDELVALAAGAAPATGVAAPSGLTGPERRLVAVVMAALPGSGDTAGDVTAPGGGDVAAEPMRPRVRALVDWLGGQLDEADGAVIVTFPGEGVATDQVLLAGRCALALRALLPGAPVVLSVGRGVLAGRLALGEAIDRAARLFAAPAGPGVRTDTATAALLEPRFEVDDAGAPGGDTRWLRRERDAEPAPRLFLDRPSPFVGRERELALLVDLFDEAVAEPCAHVALVTGAAGAGKSRLGAELRRALAGAGREHEALVARAEPLRARAAFAMLRPALRRMARVGDGEPYRAAWSRLRARLEPAADVDAERAADFVCELLGLRPPPEDTSVQLAAAWRNPQILADQLRRAFVAWIGVEAAARPLLFVLEDLQWADPASLALVEAALRALPDRPWLVLALGRQEANALLPDAWGGRALHRLPLQPLSRRAAEAMVRQVLPEPPAPARLDALVTRAAGNALYLEELIRAESRGDERVPESVLGVVTARLETLEPGARRFLRAGSVFGEVFWAGAAAALTGVDAGAVRGWTDELLAQELVQERPRARFPGERELVFRHALLRDAAYALLTEGDRALGHRLAGAWLERAGEGDAAVLAEHFERGGVRERAAVLHLRAAEAALAASDFDGALAQTARSRACDPEDAHIGARSFIEAEVHTWRASFPDVERAAAAAAAVLPRGSTTWWLAMIDLAVARGRLGNAEGRGAIARELGSVLPDGADGPLVTACLRLSVQLRFAGRAAEADALAPAALAAAGPLAPADPGVAAAMHNLLAVQAQYAGDSYAAFELFRAACVDADRAGNMRQATVLRGNTGFAALETGQHEVAEAELATCIADAERLGLPWVVAGARQELGRALARRGRHDESAALLAQVVATFQTAGERRQEGITRAYLGAVRLAAGALDDAEREAQAAVDLLERVPALQAPALAVRARVALARGDVAGALAAAGKAMGILAADHVEEGEALVRLVHAEALDAAGRRDEARAAVGAAAQALARRAEKIASPAGRERFLAGVPEHARTLALAEAWGADQPARKSSGSSP
jgi:hypothetical protein